MRALLVIVAVLAGGAAHAEDKADALFKKGKKLLGEKRYLEACATFEKVNKIDPGIGAKLNVAKCYEEWGKLAKAYDWYKDAEKQALDTNDKRSEKIKELVDNLDSDIPRLTIKVPAGADLAAAALKLDGKPFEAVGSEQRLDPGSHVVEYLVDGQPKTKNLALERGASREVTLDLPKTVAKPPPVDKDKKLPPDDKRPAVASDDPGRTKRLAGLGIAGVGVVTFGVASYLTIDARSSYKDALKKECNNATDMCTSQGLKDTHDARKRANIATVLSIVAAGAVGGGALLYFTAPKRRTEHARLMPAVDRQGASVVLVGGF